MAIDIYSLSQLITEFRALQAKDSVSPDSLGYILQRLADLVSSASTASELASLDASLRELLSEEGFVRSAADAGLQKSVNSVRTAIDSLDEQFNALIDSLRSRIDSLEEHDEEHVLAEVDLSKHIDDVDASAVSNASAISNIRQKLASVFVTSVVPIKKLDGSLALQISYRQLNGQETEPGSESFEIPVASAKNTGLLDKADFARFVEAVTKADNASSALGNISHVADITEQHAADGYVLNIEFTKGDGSRPDTYASSTLKVPLASAKRNGLMSAEDKAKLDAMVSGGIPTAGTAKYEFWFGTQQEYDALGDYSDSKLYFIVDEDCDVLSTLRSIDLGSEDETLDMMSSLFQ